MNWLGEKKRTARLAHVGDEKDVITAHVDRIVKKNVLPQKLVEDWKPLKFRNAEYAREDIRHRRSGPISNHACSACTDRNSP